MMESGDFGFFRRSRETLERQLEELVEGVWFVDDPAGEDAGGFDKLGVVQEGEGLSGGVGGDTPGGAFLAGGSVESEHGGVDVLALPKGVK